LSTLFNQENIEDITLDVYLVDDFSTDGTTNAIEKYFPQVNIIQGTGDLFWNGGMRLAFSQAKKKDYDFHLWLNDDTFLFPNALKTLLVTHDKLFKLEKKIIVSGSTCDPISNKISTGGFRFKWHKIFMHLDLIEPSDEMLKCETTFGNCLLIPRLAFLDLGNLSSHFRHFLGDIDYGLRARKNNYEIWIVPNFIGTTIQCHKRVDNVFYFRNISEIFEKLDHPKGLSYGNDINKRFMPLKEWTIFLKEHLGIFWLVPWFLTYRKLVLLIFTIFKGIFFS
jgi:GT2 family glycosyltransferase